MPHRTPLILFSGMAADDAVFAPQRVAFPHLIVPRWIRPLPGEDLSAYCARWATDLQKSLPSHTRPIIGGASFGGIVALEMARHLNPRAVLLIGSIRSPAQLPLRVRMLRPFQSLIPFLPISPLQRLAAVSKPNWFRKRHPYLTDLATQFTDADPYVLRWSALQILNWNTEPHVTCPIHHIHGEADHVLPAHRTQPDRLIPGGGHVISLTHPQQVNAFITEVLNQYP